MKTTRVLLALLLGFWAPSMLPGCEDDDGPTDASLDAGATELTLSPDPVGITPAPHDP